MTGVTTLHVTNGDSVLYVFKKAGILGTHVAWRDALNEGPVPAGLTLEETSAVRARYLAERGYAKPIKIIHDFEIRDAQIRKAGEFPEVVLWFEHDLFDQLQLLQVLTAFEELQLEPGRVTLVQSDHYLGSMTADELSPLLPRRRTATAATFKSARRAWERFTSPSPADLFAAAQEDSIGLPFLRAALKRLCEEYPLREGGLSRSQRQALAAVAQGPAEAAGILLPRASTGRGVLSGRLGLPPNARRSARRTRAARLWRTGRVRANAAGPPGFVRRRRLARELSDRSLGGRRTSHARARGALGRRRGTVRPTVRVQAGANRKEKRRSTMPHDELSIDLKPENHGDALLFKLRGSLDLATSPTVRAALSDAQETKKDVVVDLTQLEFLDSTGLGALIGAHRRATEHGGSLRLIVNDGPILRLLTITGLIRVLSVYHSIDDALGDHARVTATL